MTTWGNSEDDDNDSNSDGRDLDLAVVPRGRLAPHEEPAGGAPSESDDDGAALDAAIRRPVRDAAIATSRPKDGGYASLAQASCG